MSLKKLFQLTLLFALPAWLILIAVALLIFSSDVQTVAFAEDFWLLCKTLIACGAAACVVWMVIDQFCKTIFEGEK